jgi:Fur family transcriptional regulator, ferric uptake regulator
LRKIINKIMPVKSSAVVSWSNLLSEDGHRSTASLRAVMSVLGTSRKALSPAEILAAARRRRPNLGLATVYRILNRLERLGMIHRIQYIHQTKPCSWFLRATFRHEHLLLCTACRKAEYFHEDDLTRLATDVSRRSGFIIQAHLLQFHGLCSGCQKLKSKRGNAS